ncbi:pyrethroid hydrolase Ces2e-like isoform X2 [Diaphorina citri]|uniref:Carboxylic ester hydrolase n=1 Tax=Diaphorina citri TaxID=121845 RepID=A0A3Q0IR31_DIACI|nr:pyrethroid hydrolase Ces2e-like isoform X2 [Diaphorina citri]XP_026678741.1 pyrethroid hydrolase Ces2e-like isoform X2 [Diaphorina citri]
MTEIIINTELGQIKGVQRSNALTNAALYSFQGIPYAAPPVGDLRFRPPQAHPGWEGTLDATKEGGICVQNDVMLGMFESGSDDCLYLNVYSPCITAGANKAVMVFVHGGGFTFGHPAEVFYGPDWLVAKDVVLVAIHYRVNIFGFLNLGLEECPGNVGLRDIMASLQWVQANISDFGGNPNNVTLFGESAGAASIHYLLMAPSTRGLFHRVIMQSGSALDSWAFHTAEDNWNSLLSCSKKYAHLLEQYIWQHANERYQPNEKKQTARNFKISLYQYQVITRLSNSYRDKNQTSLIRKCKSVNSEHLSLEF